MVEAESEGGVRSRRVMWGDWDLGTVIREDQEDVGEVPEAGGVLSVYSDGSVDEEGRVVLRDMGGSRVSSLRVKGAVCVWMIGGKEGEVELQRGWLMREGWVDGDAGVVDSTRAELEGVVDAMRVLWQLWQGEVVHRLDNQGVVDVFGKLGGMMDGEVMELPHADVWAEALWWWRRWDGRYRVEWVRGHPEKRKDRCDWSREEWGNWWCDRRCVDAMRKWWPWGGVKRRVCGCKWEARVEGVGVGRGLTEAVRWRVQEMRLKGYLVSRGMGRQYGRISRVMMELGHQEPEKGVVQAVRIARCMWGHMATRECMWRTSRARGFSCPVEGCGGVCEDGWHVLGECRGGRHGGVQEGWCADDDGAD